MQKLKNKTDKGRSRLSASSASAFIPLFMVAKKVEVRTKSPFSEEGYIFASAGAETYGSKSRGASDGDDGHALFTEELEGRKLRRVSGRV